MAKSGSLEAVQRFTHVPNMSKYALRPGSLMSVLGSLESVHLDSFGMGGRCW